MFVSSFSDIYILRLTEKEEAIMEQATLRSLAKITATTLWVCVLLVGFVSLLILFGDHYRGHAPSGVIVLSMALIFCTLLCIRAMDAYGSQDSMQTAIMNAAFDTVNVYCSSLLLFGSWAFLAAWLGNGSWVEIQKSLFYATPGALGCLFWFVAQRA